MPIVVAVISKPVLVVVVKTGPRGAPGAGAASQWGTINLSAEEVTHAVLKDTWYPILGVFADGNPTGFSLAVDGKLTHTGTLGNFLINGVSDLAVDKVAKITYGLFFNDVLVPGAETPHDFIGPAKTQNISITEIAPLIQGGVLQIKLMSDIDDILVTVTNLKVTFWGG